MADELEPVPRELEEGRPDPLTRPPFRTAVVFAVVVLLVAGLAVLHVLRPFGTPRDTLSRLHAVLRAANLEALRSQAEFDFRGRTDSEVRSRGQALFDSIVAVYEKQRRLGRDEVQQRLQRREAILEAATKAGEQAFWALPEDERWHVWVGQRKLDWVFAAARSNLSVSLSSALPTTAKFLEDADELRRVRLALGREQLKDAEKTLLDQALATPDLLADPFYAEVVQKAERQGERALDRPTARLQREMYSVERGSTPRPSVAGARDNEDKKKAALGMASLKAEDTTFLQENEPLFAAADREPFEWSLGWGLLTEADRQTLGNTPYADFVAAHDAYVEREGDRLYRAFLTETFGGCDYAIEKTAWAGQSARSLFRSDGAALQIQWTTAECGDYLGRVLTFRYREGQWVL